MRSWISHVLLECLISGHSGREELDELAAFRKGKRPRQAEKESRSMHDDGRNARSRSREWHARFSMTIACTTRRCVSRNYFHFSSLRTKLFTPCLNLTPYNLISCAAWKFRPLCLSLCHYGTATSAIQTSRITRKGRICSVLKKIGKRKRTFLQREMSSCDQSDRSCESLCGW